MEGLPAFHHFDTPATYPEFQRFLKNNIPCTFGPWISASWPAVQHWVRDGRPNFKYLCEKFGKCKASVTKFTSKTDFECNESSIKDFMCYWENLSENKTVCNEFPLTVNVEKAPSYLKDWHFTKDCNADDMFSLPALFRDDWMNKFWDYRPDSCDDYRFGYFGPAGSFTPFHADVFRSYSWSVNVCGRKKWLILYPGEELKLVSEFNVEPQCVELGLNYKILEQNSGEGIFVPSGWFHQVLNVEDTISLNHNWCNIYCAPLMWTYLKKEYTLVEKEISDCRDVMTAKEWSDQCQLLLKCNLGIDYTDFLWMLFYTISKKSMSFRVELIERLSLGSDTNIRLEDVERSLRQMEKGVPVSKVLHDYSMLDIEPYSSLLLHMFKDTNLQYLISVSHNSA